MNKQQKTVLIFGTIVFVSMGLVPPWHGAYGLYRMNGEWFGGYGPVWNPPTVYFGGLGGMAGLGPEQWEQNPKYATRPPLPPTSRIDIVRLAVQWLVVIAGTPTLIVFFGGPMRKPPRVSSN